MKRLILMRHAKTEPWYPGGGDESRALLPRGKRDAKLVGAELRARGWVPDMVLVSSARRTRETWTELHDFMPEARHSVIEALYLAGTSALEAAIGAHDKNETLMVLGHNPGIHDLAGGLSSRGGSVNQHAAFALATKMPTAAVALFEAREGRAFHTSAFLLQDFIIAKKLRPDDEAT